MGALGITPDMVINSMTKDYQDSLAPKETDTEEEKNLKKEKLDSFVNDMKEAAAFYIQNQIDKLEALYKGAQTTVQNVITAAPMWAGQISAMTTGPDPMAPKSGIAIVASIKQSVSMAKASIEQVTGTISEITSIIEMFMISLPPAISTMVEMVNTASQLLSAIPL